MSAFGINSLLNMGNGALFASQASIQTTGNNISNVNTKGYSRQYVDLRDRTPIDYYPGQVGQGVEARQILRNFDRFVENAYLDKATLQRRYEEEYGLLRTVETAFNEANSAGISNALASMFKAWNTLAQSPDSDAARVALISQSQSFASIIRNTDMLLSDLEDKMDAMIAQEVDTANRLIHEIAMLNREINIHTVEGRNNPNALLDERDRKVRELNGILDIKVQDNGAGHFFVTTGSGQTLVQDDIAFGLQMRGPNVENNLSVGSPYNGTVGYSGKDGYEYTIEIISGGSVDDTGAIPPPPGTAQFRVSLDGGRTWMTDEHGVEQHFYATNEQYQNSIKNLEVFFTGNTNLQAGDKFIIVPKADVYWDSPTAGPIDISTQIFPDGIENGQRISGGTLGGFLEFRDRRIGVYRDQLAAFSKSLIWEVNRVHSQGAGLEKLSSILGSYDVNNTRVPLGSPTAGFAWGDRLQPGNVTFAIYDAESGESVIPYPGLEVFSPDNFDPAVHSLEDVCAAINNGPGSNYLEARIVDNKLQITAKEGYSFGITADTSGLAAGLGLNTFFTGVGAEDMGVRHDIVTNRNLLNAGRVNGAGEGNSGDNITAQEIADIYNKNKKLNFSIPGISSVKQGLSDYYGTLVTRVGAETANVGFLAATERTMANELGQRREEISGVSLDEEMSNLIKFQSSYKAAAKLITTADQMLQTLLSLKQ